MSALPKISLLTLFVAGPAQGHHSFAMFDLEREIELEGVVTDFQWANPHVWLEIRAAGADGTTTEWSLEMGSTGMLTRSGWKSSMLKPDDKVSIVFNPLKSGAPSGRLVTVTLPDGRVMGPGGAPPPVKPAF